MSEKMPVRIVPMTADHLDAVAALERICFSDPWSRNLLAAELDNDLSAFSYQALTTVLLAVSIAVGMLFPTSSFQLIRRLRLIPASEKPWRKKG